MVETKEKAYSDPEDEAKIEENGSKAGTSMAAGRA